MADTWKELTDSASKEGNIDMADTWKKLTDYVDDQFPYWQKWQLQQTFMTPPVYIYFKYQNQPSQGASNYTPAADLYNNMDLRPYTQSEEEYVINVTV